MLVRDDLLPPVCFIDFGMAEVLEKALDPYHMVMYVCLKPGKPTKHPNTLRQDC